MEPHFFATPAEFRAWLDEHHDRTRELWVGYYKKGSGRPSITWPESVDEALCVGWIDGVRKRIDEESYAIRFTPRKPSGIWSAVNIRRMGELMREGRVAPAGAAAFQRRSEARSAVYSHEQGEVRLEEEAEREFRADEPAWRFFEAQAPSYRKAAVWWVVSAKREETRRRRLAALIEDSRHGRKLSHLTWGRGAG